MESSTERDRKELYPLTDQPIKVVFDESGGIQEVDMWTIDVGNTGLIIIIYDKNLRGANQHFMPDKNIYPVSGKEIQYGLTYALAIGSFANWWNANKDNLPENTPRFSILYGGTNETMHNFRKKLLGKSYQDLGEMGNDYYYEINLEELTKDDVVMKKLQKLGEKCRQQNYQTIEPAPSR